MHIRKSRKWFPLVICFAVALCVGLWPSPSDSAEGMFETVTWLTTGRSANLQDACDSAQLTGKDCVELCYQLPNGNINASGLFCCIDPSKIGGVDSEDECDHWIDPSAF